MLINGNQGLPGGHVEYDEQPDEAIAREIYEELGVKDVLELQQRAFWKDLKSDRIILGYTGRLDETVGIVVDGKEVIGTMWVSIEDIKSDSISIPTFRDFLLDIFENSSI